MAGWLRQSTAAVISFGPFVDKTDGVTYETGLVSALDHGTTGIMLSKNGGALTIRHATVTATTYDARGHYLVTLDTTDTATLGRLRVEFSEPATCLHVWEDFQVLPPTIFDSFCTANAGAIPAAVAGASGGLLISGSNAGTTTLAALTVTGALTAGTNAIPWNAAYDAEVESECDDALKVLQLDHLCVTPVVSDADMTAEVADHTILSNIMTMTGDTSDYAYATDSLEGIQNGAATVADVWAYATKEVTNVVAVGTGAIATTSFAAGAINAAALGADCITAAKIADDAISAEHLNTGALTADAFAADAIVAATLATGAITADAFAANAIVAATLATDCITSAKISTDAVAEIVDAVWDEDVDTTHQIAGTAGKKLDDAGAAADPLANAVPGAYAAGTAGKVLGDYLNSSVAAVKVDTAAIKVKTDYLPSATAGTTGGVFIAGTNAATTITTGLTTTFTGNLTGSVASVTGAVGSVTGNVGGSVASVTGAVGSVTGAVGSVTGNIGGNLAGSVGSVTGAVGSVTGAVGSVTGNVGGSVASVTGSVGSVVGNVGGSVASVTGAVGSVTGNVGGNVVGSVGSVVGHTAQTGDCYARLGAPAGVSVSADIAAVKSDTTAILIDTAEIGAAGAGLTAINLPDQTMNITGDITGNLSGSVGSVTTWNSIGLKKNTAYPNFMFVMRDVTNHNPATGKTVTGYRTIDAGAPAATATPTATEVGNGIYRLSLAAADLNGDSIMFRFITADASCDDLFLHVKTQS